MGQIRSKRSAPEVPKIYKISLVCSSGPRAKSLRRWARKYAIFILFSDYFDDDWLELEPNVCYEPRNLSDQRKAILLISYGF